MATDRPSVSDRFRDNVNEHNRIVRVIAETATSMDAMAARTAEVVAESRELLAKMSKQLAKR